MELGNLIFGHSRGEFEIERGKGFEEEIDRLFDSFPENKGKPSYLCNYYFENDVFSTSSYYWGDDEKEAEKPNFLYKPTGLEIRYYKYPLRDAYSNQKLTLKKFKGIIDKCIESIKEK